MTNDSQPLASLDFTHFAIHLIYGYFVEPSRVTKEWAVRFKNGETVRNGWVPPYNLNHGPQEFYKILLSDFDNSATVFYKGDDVGERSYPDTSVSAALTSSPRWGPGTLTLTLQFPEREKPGKLYTVGDILRILHLLPRIRSTPPRAKLNQSDPPNKKTPVTHWRKSRKPNPKIFSALGNRPPEHLSPLNSAWHVFSDPFKICATLLTELYGRDWMEFPTERRAAEQEIEEHSTFYGTADWIEDPQIPYIYLDAFVPDSDFAKVFRTSSDTSFRDRQEARAAVAPQIGALLGRWIVENNVQFTNLSYYDARRSSVNGAFISQHRDSQIFVTASNILALSFHSPEEADPKPSRVTAQTLLRYFEYSRLRWHHILWTNRALDYIVEDLMQQTDSTRSLLPLITRLSELRARALKTINDPMQHIWGTMVASDLPEQIEARFVDQLEKTTLSKFSMIERLIQERKSFLRNKDFSEYYSS